MQKTSLNERYEKSMNLLIELVREKTVNSKEWNKIAKEKDLLSDVSMTFVSGMNIKNFKELYMIKLKKEKSGIFFLRITLKLH